MINVGDLVKVKTDCTIEELAENKWNKAHKDTLKFLKECDLDEEYEVKDVSNRGNAVIEINGEDLYVNYNLLEVTASADIIDEDDEDDEAVEMTLEEIQEELGYRIKIVG